VYVDDIVILSDTEQSQLETKESLSAKFQMKDLGQLHVCLGINAEFNSAYLKLHQKHYIQQIVKKYGMSECNITAIPFASGG